MAHEEFCGIEDVAAATELSLETVRDYARRGWFDHEEGHPDRLCKGDSIYRCGLISHLRKDFRFGDDEIDGVIKHMDAVRIARMGGGRVESRYVPFEQELAKAGPVWICVGLGEHPSDRPIRFVVHGKIDGTRLDFLVIRSDAVLAQRGTAKAFELLGRTYAQGVIQPGLPEGSYRIHLGGCASYEFKVSRQAREDFVELALRYFRGTRCGEKTEFHPACHLDDALRDDDGTYHPLVGGWHDAGDFCHITSTTVAGYYLAKALEAADGTLSCRQRLLDEAMHGADYNLRARDPRTGQVFENKGVGKGGFDGKFGDNHRLTDNIILSGDERHIRTAGSIETTMSCLSGLAVMAREHQGQPRFRAACIEAGEKGWVFQEARKPVRVYHIAKRLMCAIEWHRTTGAAVWLDRARIQLDALLATIDADGDVVDLDGKMLLEHYQHGTPMLALAMAVESAGPLAERAREAARRAADRLVALSRLQPYGVTCYAVARDEHLPTYTNHGTVNRWHPLGNGKSYRLYQPITTVFWQGSVSQLSVLGIALAILGRATGRSDYLDLAARHWDWCVGLNPYQACMTSGWGACEAAPQSGAVGYMPGGTYQGPIGDQDDEPYFQVGDGMRIGEEPLFNFGGPSYCREYWSPLSGALVWLRLLLPS